MQQGFFDLLKDYDEPLWVGYMNYSKLFVVAQVFNIKSDYKMRWPVMTKLSNRQETFYLKGMVEHRTSMLQSL